MPIQDLDYEQIKRIQKASEEKSRSTSYIHRLFNTLRRVARYGTALQIPNNIWMMYIRAGAVTVAKSLGVDPYALRDAAEHTSVSTTNHSLRNRSEGANRIVQFRRNR
ncbi:hypothetical protein [uncultured Roseovarius sp.]|uniref:hypothetical protein n=1 Tax=uncultured Roseovarius sp. TaxID=293344 RepID=UPI002606A8BC|nr:hypothetical protein [uncultured Roseovarius sp.]